MKKIFLIIILLSLSLYAQTYIKAPALIEGVTSITSAAGTTTLTKDSQTNQIITGVQNHTIKLPDATTLPEGRRFYISNQSTGVLDVDDNNDSLLAEILTTNAIEIRLLDNSTSSGTWDVANQYTNVDASIVISGILPIANGGTNKALTLSAGGVPYFDADSFEVLSAGTSGQILRSGGSGSPSWSTATFPSAAGTSGTLLQSNGTNWVNTTATYPVAAGNSGTVLRSNGTNWVNSTPTYPNTATIGKIMIGDGTNWIESTATYPSVATSAGTILRADGTNWLATTATFPNTTTINQILYSSASNVVGGITSANTGALITNSSGVPSFTTGGVANRLLRTDGTDITFAQAVLTTDVTGVLPMANGGTNKNMTAVNGGVVYTDSDSLEVSAAGTTGQTLTSAGAATPVWSYGARMLGKIQWAATASCAWSTTSTSYGNYAADADCPTPTVTSGLGVTATAPGTKIPAIVLSAIQAGTISIKAWGSFRANAAGATTSDFRFFDATNSGGDNVFTASSATAGTPAILGSITYGSAQGSTTINIQAKNRTGGGGNATEIDARNETLTIEVWWSP